ncbi:hypothetical protein Syun_012877 [Stephania yunnanensis]|uniref:C2 domain-containing protein n=1 Tax=Stephania yunnanensis TaxID=152371 RepID=A0AAP0K2K9_9MAGN
MNSRKLEVTVISAEDLRINDRPIKKNAFATIRIDSNNFSSTRMDSERGSYPCWNQKLSLALPYHINFISVEVHCGVARSKVRPVASAKVPVSDIDGDYVPSHFLHFLSYRLRQRDGERNGIINLCIRVLLRPDDQINVCRTLGPLGFSSEKNWSKKLNGGHEVPKGVKVGDISHNVALGIPIATVYGAYQMYVVRLLALVKSGKRRKSGEMRLRVFISTLVNVNDDFNWRPVAFASAKA